MMNKILSLVSLMTVVASSATGCTEDQAVAATKLELSPEVVVRIETILGDYEGLRAVLAGDRLDEVAALATKLEVNAVAAKAGAPKDIVTRLAEMKKAVARLKAGDSADNQRRAFGELSRAVVLLIAQHRALAKGRHIFKCPMAQGYEKWVQTSPKLENPYMGGRMLRCGTDTEWNP